MGITDTVKWRAVYNDGTHLDEKESNGTEHPFKEIDMKRIKLFQLLNQQNIAVCQVNLSKEKRLIFARRNIMTTGGRLLQQGDARVQIPIKSHQIVIILGWQKTVNGTNTKSIFYLLPDGRIEMDDDWHEDSLHSKVSTPGLEPEPDKPSGANTITESAFNNNEKAFSESNDSAFKNKN